MPTHQCQFAESFAYDGVLTWPMAVWIFAGWAVLVGGLLWRERAVTGNRMAVFFYLLRLTALGVVLWMLLGPTHVATRRTTIPQTLAIVVDTSQSMDVVETLPKIEQLRWQQSIERDTPVHPELSPTDAALAALRYAAECIRRAATANDQYAPDEEVERQFTAAKRALEKADEQFALVADRLQASDQELANRAADLADGIRQSAIPLLEQVIEARNKSGADDSGALMQELLDDSQNRLRIGQSLEQSVVTRIENLSEESALAPSTLSRKQLLEKTLDRLEIDLLAQLASKVNIKRVRVDEAASLLTNQKSWNGAWNPVSSGPPTPSPKAQSNPESHTNLSAAIELLGQDASAESIVAGVLLSDGGHNAKNAAEPRVAAAGLAGLALHVVPVGCREPPRDLVVSRVDAPSAVTLNDKIVIEALVTGHYAGGEEVTVELRRAGQRIDERKFILDGDREDHRVRFTVPAEVLGQQVFDITVRPLVDEASATNNSAAASVRVVRDTTRVLLADRISRWEYRYLDQLFRRDKHVQFDKLLYAPLFLATGALETTKQLPRDVEGWGAYDVVILGDLEPQTLDAEQQSTLAEWVQKRGGRLIVIAGREFMPHTYRNAPLAALLPVQDDPAMSLNRNGYLPTLTTEGSRNEVLQLADNPAVNADLWAEPFRAVPIFFLSSYCIPKPAAHVLLGASPASDIVQFADEGNGRTQRALMAWQDVGAGRVVYLSSPVTYHLRFRRGDELHHRFWGQLLRWLTAPHRGQGRSLLFVKMSQTRFESGQPVDLTASLSDENGSPISGAQLSAIASPSAGPSISIPLAADEIPGRYLGKFDSLEAGAYRITIIGDQVPQDLDERANEDAIAIVNVFSPENIEMHDTRGNRALLHEIAEVTGGQVLPPTAIGEILELSATAPRVIENSERTPLWNRWRYFWIVIGCLVTEWSARRWIGLV